MNKEAIAERVAQSVVAVQGGPVWKALDSRASDSFWNTFHDLESELEDAAHEYDVAASYAKGERGSAAAAGMRDAIMSLKEQIERLSMKAFGRIVKQERHFVQQFGTPDEYAEAMRREIFPASDEGDQK